MVPCGTRKKKGFSSTQVLLSICMGAITGALSSSSCRVYGCVCKHCVVPQCDDQAEHQTQTSCCNLCHAVHFHIPSLNSGFNMHGRFWFVEAIDWKCWKQIIDNMLICWKPLCLTGNESCVCLWTISSAGRLPGIWPTTKHSTEVCSFSGKDVSLQFLAFVVLK